MISFGNLLHPPITFERFCALRAQTPKRICFGSTHSRALKRVGGGKALAFLNVPFLESFDTIFPWRVFANKKGKFGGYFRAINSESEYDEISQWLGDRADLVFIRSLFKTALAAGEHYADEGRTEIGELEKAAKYDGSMSARRELVDLLAHIITTSLGGQNLQGLISVPSSDPNALSLPNFLAQELSDKVGLPDLNSALRWSGEKGEIKTLSVEDKWYALEQVGMNVDPGVASRNLLLIDDMYQSGATAHFVASQLRAARANDLHLLCVSKSLTRNYPV